VAAAIYYYNFGCEFLFRNGGEANADLKGPEVLNPLPPHMDTTEVI